MYPGAGCVYTGAASGYEDSSTSGAGCVYPDASSGYEDSSTFGPYGAVLIRRTGRIRMN